MFVQVMRGKVADAALLQRQMDTWRSDLKPGAIGFLGSTSGVTPEGVAVTVARFESAAAAEANGARPQQSSWWAETAPAFDGEVTFIDCSDVDLLFDGGSDAAGFVQVMEGRALDPQAMRAAARAMEDDLHKARPDILGGIVAWHGDRDFTQVVYFTSQADARKGEADDQTGTTEDWAKMFDGPMTFFDLPDPSFA